MKVDFEGREVDFDDTYILILGTCELVNVHAKGEFKIADRLSLLINQC